jgi:hypothetical protein
VTSRVSSALDRLEAGCPQPGDVELIREILAQMEITALQLRRELSDCQDALEGMAEDLRCVHS